MNRMQANIISQKTRNPEINLVYQTTIRTADKEVGGDSNVGVTATTFKTRHNNHKMSFRNSLYREQYRTK